MSIRLPANSWPRDPTTCLPAGGGLQRTALRADGRWWGDPWVWGFLLAAGLLWLPHLQSSGLLWQDEAETAVLAKNVLRFGYPKAFDGINRINPVLVTGPGDAWSYHPWLQFYVTALSFWLFGASTVTARLPFALIGVACVVLTYRLTLAMLEHPGMARLTGLLTLCSVPLILHARQCRYYTLAVLAMLGVVWTYTRVRDGRRHGWIWFAMAFVGLFHSHHGAWAATGAALGLDCWHRGFPRGSRRPLILVGAITAAITLPWLWILKVSQHHSTWAPKELSHHAQFYVRELNRFIVPLGLFLMAWLLRGLRPRQWWRSATARQREQVRFVLLLVACHLVFLVAVPTQRHFRYLIHLLPFLYLLEAAFLWCWLSRRPGWLIVLCALLITTDLVHYSGFYAVAQLVPRVRQKIAREHGLVTPRSLLADYGYELTHNYRGPLEGIVETLQRTSAPGETVKIPYGDHAIMFYTGLKVVDMERFLTPNFPNWIIPRRDWIPGDFETSAYLREIEQRYDRLEIAAPDLIWENRPDPGYHKFRTVRDAPRVVLYHRRADAPEPGL